MPSASARDGLIQSSEPDHDYPVGTTLKTIDNFRETANKLDQTVKKSTGADKQTAKADDASKRP